MTTRREAAQARAAGYPSLAARPSERRFTEDPTASRRGSVRVDIKPGDLREIERNGMTVVRVGGMASVTGQPYEMWDMFGPYDEIVARGVFAEALSSGPAVEFNLNHGKSGGASMASTLNDTLDLREVLDGEPTGLDFDAFVDPRRGDVQDMLLALERRDLQGASFRFMITSGRWDDTFTQYTITGIDLDRGDVSSVNFGANPAAWSELRSASPAGDVAPARASRSIPDDPWTRFI
ncbi:MAG: HK97 family phage prohead protease [Microbacterium sp.]